MFNFLIKMFSQEIKKDNANQLEKINSDDEKIKSLYVEFWEQGNHELINKMLPYLFVKFNKEDSNNLCFIEHFFLDIVAKDSFLYFSDGVSENGYVVFDKLKRRIDNFNFLFNVYSKYENKFDSVLENKFISKLKINFKYVMEDCERSYEKKEEFIEFEHKVPVMNMKECFLNLPMIGKDLRDILNEKITKSVKSKSNNYKYKGFNFINTTKAALKPEVMNSYVEMFINLNPYKTLSSIDFVSSYVDLNFKKIALSSIELSNDDLTINGLTKLDFLDLQKEIGVLKGDEMAMILDKLTLRVNIPEATKDKKLKL